MTWPGRTAAAPLDLHHVRQGMPRTGRGIAQNPISSFMNALTPEAPVMRSHTGP